MWRRKSQIQTYFDSQSHSSYNKNKSIETSVTKFSWILPGFLTSKLLEVGLYPTTSPPAPLPELASRSSIEIPSLLFIILNAGTQQTRLQSACSIGVARGAHGAYPTTFLAYIVILCFGRRYPKQNSVIRLKSNILAPATFWAGCAATM